MATQRTHWIDVSKGILILLLLFHHFTSAKKVLGIDSDYFFFLTSWEKVYTPFFMQAFLIMSGYCSNFNKPSKQFLGGVFKQLIVPFVFFEFVYCCISSIENSQFNVKGIYEYWIASGGTSFWFINALILSKIAIYYFRKLTSSSFICIIVTLVFLVFAYTLDYFDLGSNFMCIRQSLGSIFFVYFGLLLKEKKNIYEKLQWIGTIYPYVLVLLLLFKLPVPASTASMTSLKLVPIFVPLSVSGTIAFFSLCKFIDHSRFLEYFGRNTLVVYGLHFKLLCILTVVVLNIIVVDSQLMGVIGSLVIYSALILCLICFVELFKRVPFKWFVGRF